MFRYQTTDGTKRMQVIKPQEGFQERFLSSSADIIFGGSGAGCGKTWSLLVEPLRHITTTKDFGAVFFRRETPQITNLGGLLDASKKIYPMFGADLAKLDWRFPNGNRILMRHLQYEDDKLNWQGTELPYIAFDELTHFSKGQFFYLMSRNRSTCGVNPYIRATCNPDPDSWVSDFIEWYIDQETGFPIPERVGKLRYFMVNEDMVIWGDSYKEVYESNKFVIDTIIEASQGQTKPKDLIKSFTFLTGSIYENKKLMSSNPQYLASLLALDKESQMQLLYGNWNKTTNEHELYDQSAFKGMFGNLMQAKKGIKYITADIAMQGADKYVLMVWDGFEVIDIKVIDKSDGKQVLSEMADMATKYQVTNVRIVYDNDGVGSYLGGFVPNGNPFNNNASAKVGGKKAYANLKTQCYYMSAQMVNEGKITVSESVANYRYDKKMTVKERMLFERKVIRKGKPDMDNKLSLIRKDEMKPLLGGESPDLMDCFMMRMFFELTMAF